jgi:chorismate synthase
MSSTTGTLFRVTTFGESHGANVGAVVDGCPARLELSESDIQPQLDRRRPGQSRVTTPRSEADTVRIVSGVENGLTLGSPIGLLVDNRDTRPDDYRSMANVPRPSHADFTTRAKYGIVASSGGGRASARETVGRVAAGAVAEKFLSVRYGVEIVAWVHSVGDIVAPDLLKEPVTREDVDRTVVRCPDEDTARRMIETIEAAADASDSVGGTVVCVCRNLPAGWGEPVFHKAEAALASAMLSIPATKGFEIGSGFAGAAMRGSEHNDIFEAAETPGVLPGGGSPGIRPATNRSGGIQGGITNGAPVVMRVAFKPPATIGKTQDTVDYDGTPVSLEPKGRHDPCVVPRAVSVVESMAALVLADLALLDAAS